MQAGAATSTQARQPDAFSQPAANLTFEERGAASSSATRLFRKLWVSSPSSTQASDGLGPLFNARACQNCHLKDGRGHPPEGGADATSMFLRLARAAETRRKRQRSLDHEALELSRPGLWRASCRTSPCPACRPKARWRSTTRTAGDAWRRQRGYPAQAELFGRRTSPTARSIRATHAVAARDAADDRPRPDRSRSIRADILAHADPDDRDGDGISGKAPTRARCMRPASSTLGRFGWKAQTAIDPRSRRPMPLPAISAFRRPKQPERTGAIAPRREAACLAMPNGVQKRLGTVEAPGPVIDLVTFYSQNLAVPARRDVDEPDSARAASSCSTRAAASPATRRNS